MKKHLDPSNTKSGVGFTLLELLVVIAIIGLLTTVVLVSVSTARTKAKTARVDADFQNIYKGIELSRTTNNKVMWLITGSKWTAGQGVPDGTCLARSLINLPDTDSCMVWLNSQWQKLGFPAAPKDPWGSPYMMDENELENGSCIGKDRITSNGSDGIYNTSGDYFFSIPFFQCPG